MVAIVANQAATVLSGVVNPLLGIGVRGFAFDEWPPYDTIFSSLHGAVTTPQYPVSTTPRAITTHLVHQYSRDFYHRIHVIPYYLNLGNVASEQSRVIDVWNAYLTPVSLSAISGGAVGVTLEGEAVFPVEFGELQLRVWNARATTDGDPSIDATFTFEFAAVPWVTLRVVGQRVVAWSFAPDWSEDVTEGVEWLTDLLISESGAEQRRSLRIDPRRDFAARAIIEGADRTMLDASIRVFGGGAWALPIWPDVQLLAAPVAAGAFEIPCSTTSRDFVVGNLVMLRGDAARPYEAAQVAAINVSSITLERPLQRTWPAGSRLYPMRSARFMRQPVAKRVTDTAWELDMRFRLDEPSAWAAKVFTDSYRGKPMFLDRPDETESLDVDYERFLAGLDTGIAYPHVVDTAGIGFALQKHRVVLHGREERNEFRKLLYALRGRQVSVWVPTHADDFALAAPIGLASNTIVVRSCGFAGIGIGHAGLSDIIIHRTNGSFYARRITGVTVIDDATEELMLDAPIPDAVATTDVYRISFLQLVRLDDDRIEINHETDVEGSATSSLVWRVLRDDV